MSAKNLIVYIVPEKKVVNGGVLSIFSQCKEARRFRDIHHSDVIICTYPGHETYKRNDLFKNDERVYSFNEIVSQWKKLDKIMLHIPECAINIVGKSLLQDYDTYLNNIPEVHINVMTQNIELLPSVSEFAELFRITSRITQTTAHARYSTQELSDIYQTPVHHLSVFNDKSQYEELPYDKKRNLIIYSPDKNPNKKKVIEEVNKIKGFETREIRNLRYDEYKHLTATAKFCITFGEGFDGYFLESYFSGSIGIAVYNDDFFPGRDFLDLPSVFKSYADMKKNISSVVKKLDNADNYIKCVKNGQQKMEKLYQYDDYIRNMEKFYREQYDFLPKVDATKLLKTVLDSRDKYIRRLHVQEEKLNSEIAQVIKVNKELSSSLRSVTNSKSWYLTKPLRSLNTVIGKLFD